MTRWRTVWCSPMLVDGADTTANFTITTSGQSITAATKTEVYSHSLSGKQIEYDAQKENLTFDNTDGIGYKTYDWTSDWRSRRQTPTK